MGIYKFGSFIRKLVHGRGKPRSIDKILTVNHFMFDVNGILHEIAQKTFGYKQGLFDTKNSEEKEQKAKYLE